MLVIIAHAVYIRLGQYDIACQHGSWLDVSECSFPSEKVQKIHGEQADLGSPGKEAAIMASAGLCM